MHVLPLLLAFLLLIVISMALYRNRADKPAQNNTHNHFQEMLNDFINNVN